MTFDQLENLIDQAHSTKRMIHILFFATLNLVAYKDLEVLARKIQYKACLSDQELKDAMVWANDEWNDYLMQSDLFLTNSSKLKQLLNRLIEQNHSVFDEKKLLSLFRTMISLSLQKASLISYKNHLKEKDLKNIIGLLDCKSFSGLIKTVRRIEEQITRNQKRPTQNLLIDEEMAFCTLLAHFYLGWLKKSSQADFYYEQICNLPYWDEETLEQFLQGGNRPI